MLRERIGAMWVNNNKQKKNAFYGSIKGTTFVVFKNYDKKKGTDPDYIVCETHKSQQDAVPSHLAEKVTVGVPF